MVHVDASLPLSMTRQGAFVMAYYLRIVFERKMPQAASLVESVPCLCPPLIEAEFERKTSQAAAMLAWDGAVC
jgi:hypothetical protein